jgi:hypothetical protein
MEAVYTEYFQKSKVFLYPLLKLKKGLPYVPKQTYVCWEHVHLIEDYRFLCEYNVKMSFSFNKFCDKYLKSHEKFDEYIDLGNNKHLFIFDFISYKSDVDRFVKGKYSQFSFNSKLIIIEFFKTKDDISEYINAFLSPDGYHDQYAKFLNINIAVIEKVYELCTPPDLDKETLINKNELMYNLLEKLSIPLDKQK